MESIFFRRIEDDGKLCEMEMRDAGISGLDVSRQLEVAQLFALSHTTFTLEVRGLFIQAFRDDFAKVASEAPALDFMNGSKSEESCICALDWGRRTW